MAAPFARITVICTGNICRSPLAEYALAAELDSSQHTVRSAGIGALVGHPAEQHSIDVAAEHGLDLTPHRAVQLTPEIIMGSDLILGMESVHSDWVMRICPASRGRVYLLGHWQDGEEVPDPYRRPRDAYDAVWRSVKTMVAEWVTRIGA